MDKRVIICSNMPMSLLCKSEAKKYFESFGVVQKLVVKPKSKKCVVEYATADDAENAMMQGGEYEGMQFIIGFRMKSTVRKRKRAAKTPPEAKVDLAAMPGTAKKSYADLVPLSELVAKKPERKAAKRERKTAKATVTLEAELLSTLRQSAVTAEEKYRVLEARDKLIRARRNRLLDLRTAAATVGTCPDMCPEKERLMREVQHQVALFEQEAVGRAMNHAVAVKQYSRSSADQEMPLPHELRNVGVLQMTMSYLMHRILNLCDAADVNVAEWYHFLWDRMRGIRKDITQQELCCQGSVQLVEQCARFHIHCSARLVAEEPSVFDQKINTENLTKCLQTLKYMYHDLAVKGERCANEAEFRAYIVLLNLNDGNFMWEVQQLKREIRRSGEIKFALKVFSSLDENNFVRFFKLVRSTTYLNACILLRYFVQVRTKALKTIVRCYMPRMSQAVFPVDQLMELLAFEGRASTMDFVEYYGLTLSDDRAAVVFNKRHFTLPNMPYMLDRAVNVIETKRTCSVGELVCGMPLPPPLFEAHLPQNSFNDAGFIDCESLLDIPERDEPDKASPENIIVIKERSDSPLPIDANLKDSWSSPNMLPQAQPIAAEGVGPNLEQQRLILEKREQLARELEMQKLREEQLEMQRREEEERRREETRRRELERKRALEEERRRELEMKEATRRKRVRDLELQRQTELEEVAQKHREEQEREQQQQQQQQQQRQEQRKLVAIKESVGKLMSDLLRQVEEDNRRERLKSMRTSIVCRFVFQKWRRRALANRRKRKALDQDPLWLASVSNVDVAGKNALNKMKRYKVGASAVYPAQEERSLCMIDLPKLTMQLLMRNSLLKSKTFRNEVFWKVGVHFDVNCAIVTHTMNSLFGFSTSPDELCAISNSTFLRQVRNEQNSLTFCVEKSALDPDVDDYNGIAIIANQLTEKLLDDLLLFLNHLADLQPMPVVFVLQQSNQVLEREVELLLKNKLISECKIVVAQFGQKTLVESIEFAMQFLAQHFRPSPPLLLNTLRGYLSDNAGGEFWQRVRSLAKWNLTYKQCVSAPKVAIGLYNQAIDKLANIAFRDECQQHANFPNIFKDFLLNHIPDYLPCDFRYFPPFWRQPDFIDMVRNTMERLKLPEYTGKWPLALENQAELQFNVHMYCRHVLQSEADKVFYRIAGKILQTNYVSWVDVVEVLSGEMLIRMDMSLPAVYKAKTIFNQLFVVYQQPDLIEHNNDNWFCLKNAVVQAEIDRNFESQNDSREVVTVPDVEPPMDDFDIDAAISELTSADSVEEEKKTEVRRQCRLVLDDFNLLLNDLQKSVAIQRTINERFQDKLKQVLEY